MSGVGGTAALHQPCLEGFPPTPTMNLFWYLSKERHRLKQILALSLGFYDSSSQVPLG